MGLSLKLYNIWRMLFGPTFFIVSFFSEKVIFERFMLTDRVNENVLISNAFLTTW